MTVKEVMIEGEMITVEPVRQVVRIKQFDEPRKHFRLPKGEIEPITMLFLPTMIQDEEECIEIFFKSMRNTNLPAFRRTVVDEISKGYVQAVNRGWKELLERRSWDAIVMLADDLWYEQEGWLERMRKVLFSEEKIGFVGPSVKCGTSPQKLGVRGLAEGTEVVERINFTGTIIKRAVIEEMGLLDDTFIHYGADFDYVHKAQEHGWKAVWVRDVYCEHDWTPGKHPEWAKKDRSIFYNRWDRHGNRVE